MYSVVLSRKKDFMDEVSAQTLLTERHCLKGIHRIAGCGINKIKKNQAQYVYLVLGNYVFKH